ncbi:MAG: pilus assembly protein TadG-related protein, partial [Hydrogenophaga sp.]
MTTTATQQGRHQAWGIRARRTPGARQRARGSVAISVAIVFGTLIVLFIGIELGYLFYQKRELQKAVDLAALAGA